MGRGRKIEDEADARRCLEAARGAGVTRQVWARSAGVDARSLNAWRINLAWRTSRAKSRAPALPVVELVPRQLQGARVDRPDRAGAQYRLDVDGVRLEFGDDASAATLRLVVEILRQC